MKDYRLMAIDINPTVSEFYKDVDDDCKISALDTSYFDIPKDDGITCPRLKAVFPLLCVNFDMYYATREIGGSSEYDFFMMMQSCLNRNADTLERQLMVYDDDIANPILGRTEKVTYDLKDNRKNTGNTKFNHGLSTTRTQTGSETNHHIEVPVDTPLYDVDRSRDKIDFNNRRTIDTNTGEDINTVNLNDDRTNTGTVTTELSDLGVRPNYESLNGFLDNNRTFIQQFINVFEECFAPRYTRVFF